MQEKDVFISYKAEELKEAESEEVKRLKARIKELEAENKALYKRAKGDGVEYLSKQDIMEKFSRKSDWALKLLKLMFQEGKAVRLGKEYYTRESDISNFLDFYKGKEVLLQGKNKGFNCFWHVENITFKYHFCSAWLLKH